MTDSAGSSPDNMQQAPPPPRTVVRSLLRASASTAVLVLIYYLLPLDHTAHWAALTMLVVGLAGLIGLVTFQVRWIIGSQFPGLRALEALATSVPLFLLLFASAYVVMGDLSASNFSQHMTHTNALYFTVTVFATVGFGDITPMTGTARLVVTGQMIVDLMILGLGARIILGAITRGRQRRQSPATGAAQSSPQPPAAG
jgi:Ion channel